MTVVGMDTATDLIDRQLTVVRLDQLLKMKFPARPKLLSPWLPSQGLAMIYAPRGIGKTFLGFSIGLSVASGSDFLGWQATESTGVVYIDGEMPAGVVQQRLAMLIQGLEGETEISDFHLINSDLNFDMGMPDLSTLDGQDRINAAIPADTGLIIVDNLSSLVSGDENDGTLWKPIQDWLIRHRSAGRSVLLIHHSGKKGLQRGTSRREDVLDTVIALRLPKDYSPTQGARFEVHYEKCRGMYGNDTRPFEARLSDDQKMSLIWTRTALTNKKKLACELISQGMTQVAVAKKIGVNKSTVSRWMNQLKDNQ